MQNEFRNNASPADKIAQLHNERLRAGDHAPTTMHQMANRGVDFNLATPSIGGDNYVTGSEPEAHWPRLPEGNPWGGGPQPGLEPSLGVEIDQQEPTGTPAEVAASIEALAVASSAAGEAEPAAPLPVPGGVMRGSANLPAEAAHSRLQELL